MTAKTRIVADMTGPEAVATPVVDEARDGQSASKLPERAIENEDGTITLPLRGQVSVRVRDQSGKTEERVYDELVFHELYGADMRAILAAPEASRVDVMLARSLKVSQPVARAIFDGLKRKDAEDAASIASFL